MNRQAFTSPFFGPSFTPFHGPFGFPRRRFVPFFFFFPFGFPFGFPFFRDDERNGELYSRHHCQAGDTVESLAEMYNVPRPVLEAVNPHIQNPGALAPGSIIQVPRMNRMHCQRMYAEYDTTPSTMPASTQEAMPWMAPADGGVPMAPWTSMPMGMDPNQPWSSMPMGMDPNQPWTSMPMGTAPNQQWSSMPMETAANQPWTAPAHGMTPTGVGPAQKMKSPASPFPGLRVEGNGEDTDEVQ